MSMANRRSVQPLNLDLPNRFQRVQLVWLQIKIYVELQTMEQKRQTIDCIHRRRSIVQLERRQKE